METVHKWKLKMIRFFRDNEDDFRRIIGTIDTFVMKQVELYPRLSFIFVIFILFLIIFNRPWILIIVSLSFFTGFHSIDFLNKNLLLIVTYIQEKQQLRRLQSTDDNVRNDLSGSFTSEITTMSDPLLNINNTTDSKNEQVDSVYKEYQQQKQKERKPSKSAASNRLKINAHLDKSISHFCSLVFNAYISPDWAPYETRKQLKLAFVKLLTSFAEHVLDTFAVSNSENETEINSRCYGVTFCKDKIIPLAFFHIRNGQNRRQKSLSAIERKRSLWKIRRLCRTLLEIHLSLDDQKCLLWMELCVSVLADGVIWNLILLGRTEIPILIEKLVKEKLYKNPISNNINMSTSTSQNEETKRNVDGTKCEHDANLDNNQKLYEINDKTKLDIRTQEGVDNESLNTNKHFDTGTENFSVEAETNIPFLLDNFLDPSHDVEQAAMIVSRWRPTLNDILNERELLYALIQYLRGQKALEFLQAVLDDSPDGSEYCRKILELEYLPGFCRSKLFLESLGLNRIDEVGLEAGTESNSLKKPVGHTRSASYGAERDTLSGIKLWKMEQSVIDGIAIYNDKVPPTIPFQQVENVETTESIFKRRHVLDSFITKFFKSVNNFGKRVDPSIEPLTARRLGIDFKDYEEFFHPDVLSSVDVEYCDVLAETTNLVFSVTSWISKVEWIRWTASGWMKLLHPILKPKLDAYLESQISELLSVDNFIQFVDLISEAFLKSSPSLTSISQPLLRDQQQTTNPMKVDLETCFRSSTNSSTTRTSNLFEICIIWILENVFDVKEIISSLNENGDEFILFCVDLLDILIAELNNTKLNTKTFNRKMSMHSTSSCDNQVKS